MWKKAVIAAVWLACLAVPAHAQAGPCKSDILIGEDDQRYYCLRRASVEECKANGAQVSLRSCVIAACGKVAAAKPEICAAASLAKSVPELAERQYQPSGNGMVGGTIWRVGYYVSPNASKEVIDRAKRMVVEQAALAGVAYNESIDFGRYNFVIGIADSTRAWIDLPTRVWMDELSNGKWSAGVGGFKGQELYNSLRDRQFDELGCHSNGAMICLAALMNSDVKASKVVLYGPQLTPQALEMWEKLRKEGKIDSLQILINQNDPVPPASLLVVPALQAMVTPSIQRTTEFLKTAKSILFDVGDLQSKVQKLVPSATVETFKCEESMASVSCHEMSRYAEKRGCLRTGPPRPPTPVPGTTVRGKAAVEPPSPVVCPN